MLISKLERIEEAPAAGRLLAYTRKRVFFRDYTSLDEVRQILAADEILEIHLFDDDKEYRALATESARYPKSVIEHVAEFVPGEKDAGVEPTHLYGDVYLEECQLEREEGTMLVMNRIDYDKNGMIRIDDYRLVMGGR